MSSGEQYLGYEILRSYFEKRDTWSFREFLVLNRDDIITIPPDCGEWFGLEAAWKTRYLSAIKDLIPDNYEALKKKLNDECSDKKLMMYWEDILCVKKELLVKTIHKRGTLNILSETGRYYSKKLAFDIEGESISITPTGSSSSGRMQDTEKEYKSVSRLTKRFLDNAETSSSKRLTKETHEQDSESSDGLYPNSVDPDSEGQDDGYMTPTPCSIEDPFAEGEEVIITDVSSHIPSSSSEFDMHINDVNISARFRKYVDGAVSLAKTKGLYVEMNTHEILSLSSILVLIPNSYPAKMVEYFGLDLLEAIHRECMPRLSLQLDIEIENVYRRVVKTCLNDSREKGIKLLSTNIAQKDELIDNFGFLILDLIRTLPYEKIRNEPSELTLITNYLDRIMKSAFHMPDKHIVRWPNTALTESKVRKFDGSRTKQPDFVISVNYQSRATNVVFVGEVTGPADQHNVYKNCLDLVRIGVFMKDCVDAAISREAGIKILGFQCIAYKIDFYVLDLRAQGLYTMSHIAQISSSNRPSKDQH
ncbi:7649_t:CDS:2 [Paraglomus occultum]|uniref:7649_t:CDS:1 n=1 Tax=Paraglomus occultum TaxID=144539 RepID=A0A9N8YXX5_9GLOM|nr:7649_t:CDS:2 [Paraglomus occultum]